MSGRVLTILAVLVGIGAMFGAYTMSLGRLSKAVSNAQHSAVASQTGGKPSAGELMNAYATAIRSAADGDPLSGEDEDEAAPAPAPASVPGPDAKPSSTQSLDEARRNREEAAMRGPKRGPARVAAPLWDYSHQRRAIPLDAK